MESRAPARGEIPVRGARNGNGARHTPTAGVGVVDDSSFIHDEGIYSCCCCPATIIISRLQGRCWCWWSSPHGDPVCVSVCARHSLSPSEKLR